MRLLFALCVALALGELKAATIVGPWEPRFKGIDYSVSTNTPGSGGISTRRQVVHALRVDLHDPDIRLFTTPRHPDYVENSREIAAYTVSDFVRTYRVQAAINANFFSERSYYLPAGTPMDVYGLAISEGVLVSPQDDPEQAAVLMFDQANQPTVVHTNWPARSTEGVFTAVAGDNPLVVAGVNVGRRNDVEPRTAFGISEDRRYLYLVAVDGRQSGYSDGSTDFETAAWMLRLGAYDAVNMDGGGSTTLVLQSSTGSPVRLNRSSAVADSGRERTVGSHFGIYAKPLPGFINDVQVEPDDTTAKISFTTVGPAVIQIDYGTTVDLGESFGIFPTPLTNHSVQLVNLVPESTYYFRITAAAGDGEFSSPLFSFQTTNYLTTNLVFDVTNGWRFFTGGEPPAGWAQHGFNDTSWSGPGPGILWVDTRATPNPDVQGRATEMPANVAAGYPYLAYYFRTPLPLEPMRPGSSLLFSGYIDDGAIVYLNGTEIFRLRMPATVNAQTLASGYPCSGDATCLDEFRILFAILEPILSTNNTLAVEVHNYNARSNDVTFGLAVSRLDPIDRSPVQLAITLDGTTITLSWGGTGVLQSAAGPDGPWEDLEESNSSPVAVTATESQRFYRVKQ